MMFYALYKWFSRFRKSYYPDMIRLYKNYLYTEWYNALSDEEKSEEDKRIRELKEKRKREGELALAKLFALRRMLKETTGHDFYSSIDRYF